VKSSVQNTHSTEWINPSKLPHVRTDNLRYFQSNTLSLEIGYLQKSWHLGRGIFFRLAGGYFEPAYGGGALEALYYPVDAHWAFGVEQATLVKRKYRGLGFTHYLQTIKHHKIYEKKFLGMQYFGNIYYTIKSWNLDCKISIGQFLAKDRGIRMEINRWFPSGLQVSLWYTITNGHDHVNKKVYYDKGFGFYIPLDFFMKQSSRTYVGYAMSAWLRDVGAVAETGKTLYPTIRLERVNKPF
jgi:hypothetical protein